jgi:polyketide cyclase/dehydrase/lipid transport protein
MALGVLVALIVVIVVIGYALPVRHRASRSAHFAAAPGTLFATIADVERYPTWRSDVKRVELVPNGAGPQRFREIGSNGTILYEIDRREPDHLFVTRIADPGLPFGGTWTQELTPSADGTTLSITEDGEVRNPIFRFVSRFILGHTGTMDHYLADLGRRVGNH